MNERERNEVLIFNAASERSVPVERAAYLDQACAGDERLRQRVEALLRVHAEADSFFDTSPDNAGARLSPTAAAPVGPGGTAPLAAVTEKAGDKIGRYKLLQQIGEGGCGTVYMAEQEEPVRRRVALKVIKLGMDTASVIARFEAERQALALMDHPNIAKVLDAGATDAGRPYFVMELVRGVRITEYCDEARLPTRERLDLFVKVCQAVQHAHQKGIIHRDIKPSNILVTVNDGVPVPKVIDFGIAKATTGQRLTDRTLFTAFEQFMGTPAYMSPEQAAMTSLDIDTRSDIYSLGVLLYELLTGKTPFDGKELLASGLDAMRHTIREKEPMRPSTRLRTMLEGERTTAAQHRQADAPKLINLLRGDLDWIVMKALEKDRSRRYDTANGLAMDVARHLTNEPVVARPPNMAYRLQKAFRRNKLVFASGATITAALLLALIFSGASYLRERKARVGEQQQRLEAQSAQKVAETERERADTQARKSSESAQQSRRLLYDSDMSLAQHAWDDGDLGRTLDLLQAHQPHPGDPDRRGFEWFYFWKLCEGDQRLTLTNHTQAVNCVASSPDGKRLATGSVADAVRIWDCATGTIVQTLPEQNVVSLAFASDGQTLGVGSRDRIAVWNLKTEQLVFKREEAAGRFRAAFSPVGSSLVIGKHGGPLEHDGGSAELWDYVSGELKQVFPESGGYVALSPKGDKLATGNWNGTIKIWDLASGRFVRSLKTGGVVAMAFSSDGRTFATSPWHAPFQLWDVTTGLQTGALTQYDHHGWSLAFSPDGRFLATGGADQTIRLWDVATRQQTELLKGHGSEVLSVAFSADGQTLASGSKDKTARLWSVHPNRTATTVSNVASHPVFSPDGRLVAAGLEGNKVALWDVATLQRTAVFNDAYAAVTFSADGSALMTRGTNFFLKTFDVATQAVQETISRGPMEELIYHAVLSPDGRILVAGLSDGTLRFSDVKTGAVITNLAQAHAGQIFQLAFSPNGKRLASVGMDLEGAKIWDTLTHKRLATLAGHTMVVLSVAFSPDGKTLATSSADNSIKLWDSTTWKEIASSLWHKEFVNSVAFSPNGKTLASAAADGTLKLWDIATRRELASLRFDDMAAYITFSPDGQTLAARCWGGSLRLWRAPVPR